MVFVLVSGVGQGKNRPSSCVVEALSPFFFFVTVAQLVHTDVLKRFRQGETRRPMW